MMPLPIQYSTGAWLFGRALAVCYLIAFASLYSQLLGLYGANGILPIAQSVQRLREVGADSLWQFPSLLLWKNSDSALKFFCILGMLSAVAAFWGWMDGIWFLLCWVLYLSFVVLGQDFLSFQWDSLLLECGVVVLFLAPFKTDFRFFEIPVPTYAGLFLVWFLLFKLMFLSGVVKLASGDPHWRDLTAMSYHYWTQPLPNPLSWWMNQLPLSFHKLATVFTFIVELVFPFLIFHSVTRPIAFVGLVGLQVLIGLTGNYAFFNLLSMGLCLPLLSNSIFSLVQKSSQFFQFGRMAFNYEMHGVPIAEWIAVGFAVPLVVASAIWLVRPFVPSIIQAEWVQQSLGFFSGFRINNPYGLFAVMTTERPELQVEGSLDGQEWRAYAFRYKPNGPSDGLSLVAPHQPRLDWQMWFAAMDRYESSPWLQNLLIRLFQNQSDVTELFLNNPFASQAPKYLRIRRAQFTMTNFGESDTWNVGEWQVYSPVFERPER